MVFDKTREDSKNQMDEVGNLLGEVSEQMDVGAGEKAEPDVVNDVIVELSRRRRSFVSDIGVALPETFARLVISEVDDPLRSFQIPVSMDQASMIATLLKANVRKRPFLSDVAIDILSQFSMGIALVSITGLQENQFLAEVTIVDNQGRQRVVPSRPSDAILLALSCTVQPPIMADDYLFEITSPIKAD